MFAAEPEDREAMLEEYQEPLFRYRMEYEDGREFGRTVVQRIVHPTNNMCNI